jgi:hypothetical protein
LAEQIRESYGVKVKVFQADISDVEECIALVKTIGESGISIDILINSAGAGLSGLETRAKSDS